MLHLSETEIALILSESAIQHVLHGDGPPYYRGGHRFASGVVGKTVFPEDWDNTEIIGSVRMTLAFPAKVFTEKQFSIYFGLVNEVLIEVRVQSSKKGLELRHAMPVNGLGVYRVDPLGRTPLPLDLSVLEF